jgi:hypothetical protein
VTYREGELRRAILRRVPRLLVVDPARGTATLSETAPSSAYSLDVKLLAQRVTAAVENYRRGNPDVWVGYEEVEMAELVAV